jgi:hypothetical protein
MLDVWAMGNLALIISKQLGNFGLSPEGQHATEKLSISKTLFLFTLMFERTLYK